MGIISDLKKKKITEEKLEKKIEEFTKVKAERKVKGIHDVTKTLSLYIVAFEILTILCPNDMKMSDFTKIYGAFRDKWKIEEIINSVENYDELVKIVYPETVKFVESGE